MAEYVDSSLFVYSESGRIYLDDILANVHGSSISPVSILELLEGIYRRVFQHIMFLCPTAQHNYIYHQRTWIWMDPDVYVADPGQQLHEYLRGFFMIFKGEPTLYIIDDY